MFLRFLSVAILMLAACKPPQPPHQPTGRLIEGNRQTPLQPGEPAPVRTADNPLPANEQTLGEGKQLYDQFNCSGCHAGGGGAIGPPLMDEEWIYGSSPTNVFYTIIEGRPQGMPAFGGKIQEYQVWRIVAYVRSLSGLHEKDKQEQQQQAQR